MAYFLNLWLWLALKATGSCQNFYFLLLLIHKLIKFSHSLTSEVILRTHKFTSIDCCHIQLAVGALWVHCGVFNQSLVENATGTITLC